ncbi:hypothetical protein BDF20DRAFT_913720 [Mycotypha africana]|uniref:uncharacterized protein n=1 Tax=Mycotypha africana TaxID=64632 RepID=UPI0022FFD003|nr:uncharacterized protein BDF20DRAFT_913720 [Mycotypha africana]KAI8977392.1 hypothetical protein BDF20DRAFT_913720 [Mycotypha africana]
MPNSNSSKRSRSASVENITYNEALSKRSRIDHKDMHHHDNSHTNNESLLNELSEVLNTIKSTPSSGEISAEVMETFKILLLEIDQLSSDDAEARRMKQESEDCLESWFDDLLARCEAEGELNLEDLDAFIIESSGDDEDGGESDAIAIAMASAAADDVEDEEEDELIIVDDDSEVGGSQVLAVL